MELAGNLLNVALALGAIIAVLLLCAFAARRLLGAPQGGGGQIRILAVRALGTRERLVLVEVAGEVTLLGVTQNGISALREVPAEAVEFAAPVAGFADVLGKLMNRSQ